MFRGHENSSWLLVPGAARRLMKSKFNIEATDSTNFSQNINNITFNEFISYHNYIIEEFKSKNFHKVQGSSLYEFEILAELQHYEASTMFIDFSRIF